MLIQFMAIFPSILIYVLWKTAFQVVYIRLPALVCSVLNVVDTVRTVKVLYWTSASVLWDVYIRTLMDFPLYIQGGADKSLAHILPDVVGRNRQCRWKDGSVHVPNCKSLLVTEAERKHVRRRERFQQHRDASCHQVLFSCKARRRRKCRPFSQKHQGNIHHCKPPSKTRWPSLNVVIFSPVMPLVLDDPKH